MTITLTDEQQTAVEDALRFAEYFMTETDDRNPPGPWSCAGLAGTGKTTVLVDLVRRLKAAGHRVAVGAFTGKAVGVINGKQNVFVARTLHALTTTRATARSSDKYHNQLDELEKFEQALASMPEDQRAVEAEKLASLTAQIDAQREAAEGDIKFRVKTEQEFIEGVKYVDPDTGETRYTQGYDVLVIDEGSMVSLRLAAELFDHIGVPKLYFGDSHQLPPVEAPEVPAALRACAVDLTHASHTLKKIHRQAAESGIIQVAHVIANTHKYPSPDFIGSFDDVILSDNTDLDFVAGFAATHQILCFTNKIRKALGPMTRRVCGLAVDEDHPWRPCAGEILTIDKNYAQAYLMKGDFIEVMEVKPIIAGTTYPVDVMVDGVLTAKHVTATSSDTSTASYTVWTRFKKQRTGFEMRGFMNCSELAECYDPDIRRVPSKNRMLRNAMGYRVQFGRVGTVHKAQGSEWPGVVYYGDMPTNHQDWSRHAYTGVTRAAKNLVICSAAFKRKRSYREILADRR